MNGFQNKVRAYHKASSQSKTQEIKVRPAHPPWIPSLRGAAAEQRHPTHARIPAYSMSPCDWRCSLCLRCKHTAMFQRISLKVKLRDACLPGIDTKSMQVEVALDIGTESEHAHFQCFMRIHRKMQIEQPTGTLLTRVSAGTGSLSSEMCDTLPRSHLQESEFGHLWTSSPVVHAKQEGAQHLEQSNESKRKHLFAK